MSLPIHIHWGPGALPWEPCANQTYIRRAWLRRGRILTDCCCRRVLPEEAQIRWTKPEKWYDQTPEIQCNPGTGCHTRPRLFFGMAGRQYWAGTW